MKKLKKIMLFAAVLSFLPVSVCNAVNANQYLSADMFANTLNMIGTGANAGLTSSGSFFSRLSMIMKSFPAPFIFQKFINKAPLQRIKTL